MKRQEYCYPIAQKVCLTPYEVNFHARSHPKQPVTWLPKALGGPDFIPRLTKISVKV